MTSSIRFSSSQLLPLQRSFVPKAATRDLVSKTRQFIQSGDNWSGFLQSLFLAGCTTGPLVDAIHTHSRLLIYDALPVDLPLDCQSSLWVVPLLGTFYTLLGNRLTTNAFNRQLGTLHVWADDVFQNSKRPSWTTVALNFVVLIGGIKLSAWLYENDVSYATIHAVLAIFATANWWVFDRTKQGLWLAALCGVAAPTAELPILVWLKWWHYPRGDVLNLIPSWVAWCYFFYTPAVGNLARRLWKKT